MKGRKGRPPGRRNERPEELGPAAPPAVELPIRWCVGCGKTTVRGWTYCARCRERLSRGAPVDADDFPTVEDLERARRAELRQRRSPVGFNLCPRCA